MAWTWEITEEHKQTMSDFMTDFWKLVKATYEMPAESNKSVEDHYWSTLTRFADALSKKYDGDPVINGIILGYLDGQSSKATGINLTIETDSNAVQQ